MDTRERCSRVLAWGGPWRKLKVRETDPSKPIDEEIIPGHDDHDFYPARVGQKIQRRYELLAKVGWGGNSTVWFALDKDSNTYVVLKICRVEKSMSQIMKTGDSKEITALGHISQISPLHPGKKSIRALLHGGPLESVAKFGYRHIALVHRPALTDLFDLQQTFRNRRFEAVHPVKQVLRNVLEALDFLHSEAHIVHGDIKPNNILVCAKDAAVYRDIAKKIKKSRLPARWLVARNRYTYQAVSLTEYTNDLGLEDYNYILTDLGEAHTDIKPGHQIKAKLMCPAPYRPPETILNMPWSSSLDIWSLGIVAWQMLEGQCPFGSSQENSLESHGKYLATIVSMLGPPPLDFLRRSSESLRFFGRQGEWIETYGLGTWSSSLDEMAQNVPDEEKEGFLAFIRKMLVWKPEDRATAKELLDDAWLNE